MKVYEGRIEGSDGTYLDESSRGLKFDWMRAAWEHGEIDITWWCRECLSKMTGVRGRRCEARKGGRQRGTPVAQDATSNSSPEVEAEDGGVGGGLLDSSSLADPGRWARQEENEERAALAQAILVNICAGKLGPWRGARTRSEERRVRLGG